MYRTRCRQQLWGKWSRKKISLETTTTTITSLNDGSCMVYIDMVYSRCGSSEDEEDVTSPEAPWFSSVAAPRGSVRSRVWRWGCWSLRPSCITIHLVYCYTLVFGLVKLKLSDFFEFSVSPTRRHAYKLHKYRCKSVRADFFACTVVNVWNSLPESVVFTSLPAFKRSIRIVDFSVFLKCNSM